MDKTPLTELSEQERAQALQRYQIIQPFLEGQSTLKAAAQRQEYSLSYSTTLGSVAIDEVVWLVWPKNVAGIRTSATWSRNCNRSLKDWRCKRPNQPRLLSIAR